MGKSKTKKIEEVTKTAGRTKKSIPKWAVITVIALLLGVGAVLALNIQGLGKGEKVKPVNGAVTIPLAKVSDGKAHFYKYAEGGKDIGFFAVKGSDGALHTAFDTCDVCYNEKKGYFQDGDFMICRNCNKKFAIVRIGPHAIGGCNPSYLASTTDGSNVVIRAVDLQAGAKYL